MLAGKFTRSGKVRRTASSGAFSWRCMTVDAASVVDWHGVFGREDDERYPFGLMARYLDLLRIWCNY